MLHYFAFPGGGIGRYVNELLRAMQDQDGPAIELACLPSFEYLQQATYPTWPGLFNITHPIPILRRLRFAANLAVNPIRAIRRAEKTGARLLHLSSIPHVTFPLWSRFLRKSQVELVATAHDVRRRHAITYLPYELAQLRRLYRTCRVLFVHSDFQKRDLIDFAGVPEERVVIVPHGPYSYGDPSGPQEELRRKYDLPADKKVALFFGDIRPDKNLDLLIRALAPHKSKVFLLVAGRIKGAGARPLSYYEQVAREADVLDSVRFDIRYIPDAEVPDLFTAADFVTLPYSATFSSQSGVLNIAASYSRPILASGAGTFRETIERFELGIVVEADSVPSLKGGLSKIITYTPNPQEFTGYLREHSWQRNCVLTSTAYHRIISR
ncbi:glycosyltransferase family 4 protein [Thermostilla marina]